MKDQRYQHQNEGEGSPGKARGPPRILYHGTVSEYVSDQVNRNGTYCANDRAFVHASESIAIALFHAIEQARKFNGTPAVLIIDTVLLPSHMKAGSDDTCKFMMLSKRCFFEYNAKLRNARCASDQSISEIEQIAGLVMRGKINLA